MNDTEREVLAALNELDRLATSMKTANPKPDLMPVFAKLDELTAKLNRGGDPSLLHFLHKKSYEKARVYLAERAAENARGAAGH